METLKEIFKVIGEVMKDVLEIIAEAILEMVIGIVEATRFFSRFIYLTLPYIMLVIGNDVYKTRGEFALGGEIFVPPLIFLVIMLLEELYKRQRKIENTIPVPEERFTIVDGSRIEVEHERLEELLIYMQSLEDYLEEEKLLK